MMLPSQVCLGQLVETLLDFMDNHYMYSLELQTSPVCTTDHSAGWIGLDPEHWPGDAAKHMQVRGVFYSSIYMA